MKTICVYLSIRGYIIKQRFVGNQHGEDIITENGNIKFIIEAKGETSSGNSPRSGKPFSSGQIRTHISVALFKVSEILSENEFNRLIRVGIALPKTESHIRIMNKISRVINKLGVHIFWVDENRSVSVISQKI